MANRTRELMDMDVAAGLSPIHAFQKEGQFNIRCEAPNGVESTFRVRSGSATQRDTQECMSHMKRFARQNQKQETTMPTSETLTVPKHHRAPKAKPVEDGMQAPAPLSAVDQELNPREYFKLCEWVRQHALASLNTTVDGFCAQATTALGLPISEAVMATAMEDAGVVRPEAWDALPAPHIVIAQELAKMFQDIGHKPSRNFERLLESLA